MRRPAPSGAAVTRLTVYRPAADGLGAATANAAPRRTLPRRRAAHTNAPQGVLITQMPRAAVTRLTVYRPAADGLGAATANAAPRRTDVARLLATAAAVMAAIPP